MESTLCNACIRSANALCTIVQTCVQTCPRTVNCFKLCWWFYYKAIMFGFHNITVLVFTHSCQYICQLWRLDHQCHLRHLLRMCWWVWVWERTWKCLEEKKCVQKCDCCIFLNLSLGHARKYTGAKCTRACLDPPSHITCLFMRRHTSEWLLFSNRLCCRVFVKTWRFHKERLLK